MQDIKKRHYCKRCGYVFRIRRTEVKYRRCPKCRSYNVGDYKEKLALDRQKKERLQRERALIGNIKSYRKT